MRRTLLALTIALLIAAPLAAAQVMKSQAQLAGKLKPLDGELEPSATAVTQGRVTYIVDAATARTATSGIEVTYAVLDKPAWLTVVVSPESDVFTFDQPTAGSTMQAERAFEVQILRSADARGADVGEIVIQARTSETQAIAAAEATMSLAVQPAPEPQAAPTIPTSADEVQKRVPAPLALVPLVIAAAVFALFRRR